MMGTVDGRVEFDWDEENLGHLKRHNVMPTECEEVITRDPFYLEYQAEGAEERYKVLGATRSGRVLIAIWTPREGRVRAVTAYRANRIYRRLYWRFADET